MNEEEKKESAITETAGAGMQTLPETAPAIAETPKNGFIAKFKAWWSRFSERHPNGSKLIWQFIKFFVFSNGVTIFQYLVYTFLPYAFGLGMAKIEWIWPGIELPWGAKWTIIGFAPAYNAAGEVIIGGGLGYTISFWIGSFLAQCINFPLQRNITYKSKGKIPFQIMWYFIAWVLITFATTALNSLWLPLAAEHLPTALYQVINTVVVGGISMVIFFPIFKIVFPEGEPKKENELTKEEKQN